MSDTHYWLSLPTWLPYHNKKNSTPPPPLPTSLYSKSLCIYHFHITHTLSTKNIALPCLLIYFLPGGTFRDNSFLTLTPLFTSIYVSPALYILSILYPPPPPPPHYLSLTSLSTLSYALKRKCWYCRSIFGGRPGQVQKIALPLSEPHRIRILSHYHH